METGTSILLVNLLMTSLIGIERLMKVFQIPIDLSHIKKIACSSGCCSAEVLRRSSNNIPDSRRSSPSAESPEPDAALKTLPSRAPSYITTPPVVHPSEMRRMSLEELIQEFNPNVMHQIEKLKPID